jgi:hypothetical protein
VPSQNRSPGPPRLWLSDDGAERGRRPGCRQRRQSGGVKSNRAIVWRGNFAIETKWPGARRFPDDRRRTPLTTPRGRMKHGQIKSANDSWRNSRRLRALPQMACSASLLAWQAPDQNADYGQLHRLFGKTVWAPPVSAADCSSVACVYRESKSERIDDEVRPVWRANL